MAKPYSFTADSAESLLKDDSKPSSTSETATVDEEIEHIGLGYFHYAAGLICGVGNASDAVELLAIGYILPSLPVDSTEKGALAAAVFIGMLAGGIVCGLFGDRIGRKPCLLLSLGLDATFGIASAFAPTWQWLVVFRVIAGFGVGGSVPSVFTLYAEYLPVHRRGSMLTIVAWFWMVGSIVTAGLAWFVLGRMGLSWRVFAGLAATPAALAFIMTFVALPESPRFYANKGRIADSKRVLEMIAAQNGKELSGRRLVLSASNLMKPEPVSKLFHPRIRRTSVLLMISWFTLSFGWYGLILWIPSLFKKVHFKLDPYEDAFMVAAANLPGNIVSTLIMDILGRKRVLGYSMGISAILAIIFAFSEAAWLTVGTACVLNAVSIAGWNALDCLSTESFPTTLRASGMGVLAACGRVGSIVGQFAFGALISVSVHALLALAAVMLLAGSVASLLLPHDPANAKLAERVDSEEEAGAAPKRTLSAEMHSAI